MHDIHKLAMQELFFLAWEVAGFFFFSNFKIIQRFTFVDKPSKWPSSSRVSVAQLASASPVIEWLGAKGA